MLVKRCETTEAKLGKTILAFRRTAEDSLVKCDRVNEQVHIKALPVLPARSQRRFATKYDSFHRNEIAHDREEFAQNAPRSFRYFQFSVNHGNFMLVAKKAAFPRMAGHAEDRSYPPRRHLDGSRAGRGLVSSPHLAGMGYWSPWSTPSSTRTTYSNRWNWTTRCAKSNRCSGRFLAEVAL